MAESKFIEKCQRYLFNRESELPDLTPGQMAKLERYETCFVFWLENSHLSENDIVFYLMEHHNVSKSQAWRDVFDIKILLGNVSKARKEWERYRANNMIAEGYKRVQEAQNALDVKIGEAMIKAGRAMADVHRLNKLDPEEMDWSKVNTPQVEPVYDPALIDTNMSISKINEVTRKLKQDLGLIEDAEEI